MPQQAAGSKSSRLSFVEIKQEVLADYKLAIIIQTKWEGAIKLRKERITTIYKAWI